MTGAAVAAGGIANGLRGFDRLRPFRSGAGVMRMMGRALAAGDAAFSSWSQSRAAGVVLVAFYPMALIMAGL